MTFEISHGDRNCPFFMLTGNLVLPASNKISVCLHKKAGICITSNASFAILHWDDSWTSEITGHSNFSRIWDKISRPFFIPMPRLLL